MSKIKLLLVVFGVLFFANYAEAANPFGTQCASTGSGITPANQMSGNPYSDTGCLATTDSYTLTVYEIGVCTSQPVGPTSSAAPDTSSCQVIFSNSSGSTTTLSGNSGTSLSGDFYLPTNGTYTYAYVKLANTASVSGSWTFNQTMYDWSGNSGNVCWTISSSLSQKSIFDNGHYYSDNHASTHSETATLQCGSSVGSEGSVSFTYNSFSDAAFVTDYSSGSLHVYLMDGSSHLPAANSWSASSLFYTLAIDAGTITSSTTGMNLEINNSLGGQITATRDLSTLAAIKPAPFYIKMTPY
jgi:hypothetical protein